MTLHRTVVCAALTLQVGCTDEAVLQLFPRERCADAGCGASVTTSAGGSSAGSNATGSPTGAGGAPAACGSLLERVQVSYPELPARAVPSNEYNPMVLAAQADSTSLLAYKEAGATSLRLLELSFDGEVERQVHSVEGEEAHALLAHETGGGAFVFMREDSDIYSPEYCRGAEDPTLPICGSMELVRFDDAGQELMRATLTDDRNVAEDDASFMYWFEHTARIVWAEDTYGVYFRSARNAPSFVSPDLTSTDSLRFVDESGYRLPDRGWTFGCFYSWSVRLAYSDGMWAAACHADITPNAHRVVIIDQDGQREVTFLERTAATDRALGGLVPAGDGFWLSYLQRGVDDLQLHLTRVTRTPVLQDDHIIDEAEYLDSDYVFRTYMAKYGDNLLLGWKSNEQLVLAVADFDSGQLSEGPVATDAPIDNFVEFVPYPNGDVGWAHSTSSSEVTVTRVRACSE
jgi:hypothetical protein